MASLPIASDQHRRIVPRTRAGFSRKRRGVAGLFQLTLRPGWRAELLAEE
jgi:hypothetical protein